MAAQQIMMECPIVDYHQVLKGGVGLLGPHGLAGEYFSELSDAPSLGL